MSPYIPWRSVCMVAVIFCATLEPSQSQGCSTEKTENATVDLKVALSRGIRGADPVHVASWEACVNTCCSGQSISGDKRCSLVVFKPQKRGNSPNCYLFYCPTEGACPLKQAAGLVTYKTIKDADVPKPTSSLNKSLDLIANGSFASPKAVTIGTSSPTTSPHWLGPSPKSSPTSKMMKILLNRIEKPVDKSHRHSHPPEGKGANPSESLDSLPTHQAIGSVTPTNNPQNLVPIIQSTVQLPAVTPPNQRRPVVTIPPSNTTATGRATADYGNTYVATVSPRSSSPAPQPTATSQVKASSLSPLPPSLSKKVSLAVLHKDYLGHGQLSRGSAMLNRPPGEKHASYLGDRIILLAVLLFGVIFLLLAQVAIGRKLLELFWHRRYSRLDYLINGMYANV